MPFFTFKVCAERRIPYTIFTEEVAPCLWHKFRLCYAQLLARGQRGFVESTGRIAAQLRAAQDEDCVVGKSSLGKMVFTFP
jgi:hypothetical protein